MDLNIQIPDNTASIFEYLQKGLFISSNSTSEEVRDMYNEIDENYEPLYQYFSQINYTLERGNEYFFFSRIEPKATLEQKIMRAFKQAMDELAAEGGVEARHARYCRNHDVLVEGMRSLGFKTLLKDEVQSPVITSFLYPDKEFDFKEFYHQLKEKGFVIYPGKISQADTFRIGNIGDVFPEDFSRLIEAIKTVAK